MDALEDWIRTVEASKFLERLEADPGFLERRDPDDEELTPLHQAAAAGRCDLVRIILGRAVSVDLPSGTLEDWHDGTPPRWSPGVTPLMCASRSAQLGAVKVLLAAGAQPDLPDYSGFTALHAAAVAGATAVANVLLSAGSDPDASSDFKAYSEQLGFYWLGTPLHLASVLGHDAFVRTLLGHGALVDPLTLLDERRPLHYASANGASQVLEALLRVGADPGRPEKFHGQTPLHYAAREGHVECVELLLRSGADPRAKLVESGFTPLDLARSYYVPETAEAICRLLRSRM